MLVALNVGGPLTLFGKGRGIITWHVWLDKDVPCVRVNCFRPWAGLLLSQMSDTFTVLPLDSCCEWCWQFLVHVLFVPLQKTNLSFKTSLVTDVCTEEVVYKDTNSNCSH